MFFILSYFGLLSFIVYVLYYFYKYEEDKIKSYSRIVQVISLGIIVFLKVALGYNHLFIAYFVVKFLDFSLVKPFRKKGLLQAKDNTYASYISTNSELIFILVNLVLLISLTLILKGNIWSSHLVIRQLNLNIYVSLVF